MSTPYRLLCSDNSTCFNTYIVLSLDMVSEGTALMRGNPTQFVYALL